MLEADPSRPLRHSQRWSGKSMASLRTRLWGCPVSGARQEARKHLLAALLHTCTHMHTGALLGTASSSEDDWSRTRRAPKAEVSLPFSSGRPPHRPTRLSHAKHGDSLPYQTSMFLPKRRQSDLRPSNSWPLISKP